MRKDSVIFLRKLLEYRQKVKEDNFLINYQYFKDIPSIENAVFDILDDLRNNNCITSNSQVTDLAGNININLTLDGITYFEDSENKGKDESIIFNVSGGQVNIANDNGIVGASINEKLNDYKAAVKKEYIPDKEKDVLSKDKEGKVFISYSWTPESNKRWVEKLVHRLEADGIQVVIDFKNLKLGHDKYAFMERTVNDDTIKKVLIICNETYKKKADGRIGGVGDESAIITSQVYGSVQQEKFIPIVNEYDKEGKPFLPNYLASRMYADLTDFERGYEELIDNLCGVKHKKEDEKTDYRDNDVEEITQEFIYKFWEIFYKYSINEALFDVDYITPFRAEILDNTEYFCIEMDGLINNKKYIGVKREVLRKIATFKDTLDYNFKNIAILGRPNVNGFCIPCIPDNKKEQVLQVYNQNRKTLVDIYEEYRFGKNE